MTEERIEVIAEHIKEVMRLLNIKVTQSNEGTPNRVAKMWANELFKNVNNHNLHELDRQMTCFKNDYESEMVIVKDISFSSTCEHHWLPFSGKVTVGYVPNEKVIGLSKIPRVVRYFSKKPQLQEQLTTEIGEYLFNILDPKALYVEVRAEHQCVKCRGAESDCITKTYFKKIQEGYEHTHQEFKDRM